MKIKTIINASLIQICILGCTCSLFLKCKSAHSERLPLTAALTESVDNSTEIIRQQNEEIFEIIEKKSVDARYQDIAITWEPQAKLFKHLSDTIIKYIEVSKVNFAGNDNSLFLKKLYETLVIFNSLALRIAPEKTWTAGDGISIISRPYNSQSKSSEDFLNDFSTLTPEGQLAILCKFQNRIRVIENNVLKYCNHRSDFIDDSFHSQFSIILSQNTKYLKAGDELEIKAGIGAFSSAASATILIDGKEIHAEESGMVVYKLKAPQYTGKHAIPVKVSFFKPDGSKGFQDFIVEYYVEK